jgi:hypothetical protein
MSGFVEALRGLVETAGLLADAVRVLKESIKVQAIRVRNI